MFARNLGRKIGLKHNRVAERVRMRPRVAKTKWTGAVRSRNYRQPKTKAAEPEFSRFARSRISRNSKLTALPQYEARAPVIYFDFFFAFFFFAMTLFLGV